MALLPTLTMPPGLPGFISEGHDADLGNVYVDSPMVTGHARRRRVYTRRPRIVSAQMILNRAQILAFHEWFEGPLQAGAVDFAAKVHAIGPGMLFWRAQFVEPYSAETINSQHWRVRVRLLLLGEPSAIGPLDTGLSGTATIALLGSARMTLPPADLTGEALIELIASGALTGAAAVVALLSVVPENSELREDGSYELREDGGMERRE